MRRRWIETENKQRREGARWRRHERDVTDIITEQSSRLEEGACQGDGAACNLQKRR